MKLEVRNLKKTYGTVRALKGINYTFTPGVYGILGANGAGKTTAMRMLCGLSKPTSGIGKVAGYDIYREAEHAAAAGIL